MTRLRKVIPLLAAAMMSLGLAQANAEDPPPEVDPARATERHAIEAGSESLFGEMLGTGETLAGSCKLTDGKIERTSVLATYACGDAQVVLQLLHPDGGAPGGVRTERFAVDVKSGTPPAGLVEAVAEKVRAREAKFTWTDVGDGRAPEGGAPANNTRWLVAVAVAFVAFVAFRIFRRRTAASIDG